MSQIFSSAMQLALQQPLTYLCRIWQLELVNGDIYRFTDTNRDIISGGDTFLFDPGIRLSAISTSTTSTQNNCSIQVTKSDNFLTMQRVRQGALDGALFSLWLVDHRAPDTYGRIDRFGGTVSTVSTKDKGLIAIELTSDLSNGANSSIGEVYSRTCRAQLGDGRCQFDLESVAVSFTVDSITESGYVIAASEFVGLADDRFKFGHILWLTGENAGLSDEIATSSVTGTATVTYTPRATYSVGDTGKIYPGCDKQVKTCGDKFANLLNFRGEPYVVDALYTGLVSVEGQGNFTTLG